MGRGAATLLEFSCAAVLIDSGGEASSFDGRAALLASLETFFKRSVELNRTLRFLVLTRPHIDYELAVQSTGETLVVGVPGTSAAESMT